MESPIYQEPKVLKDSIQKARFRMILQDLDTINANRRMYPSDVISEGLNDCNIRMKRKAFFGELDHPFPTGKEEFDAIRQTTVSLEKVSHYICDYEIKNKQVIGEIETANTNSGYILLGLLKDKAGIGMSMRGVAELERTREYNRVMRPLTIIGYDAVSMPSHTSALVDFNEMKFESKCLMENSRMICVGGKCFLPDYFDKLVESKIITFFDRWV